MEAIEGEWKIMIYLIINSFKIYKTKLIKIQKLYFLFEHSIFFLKNNIYL